MKKQHILAVMASFVFLTGCNTKVKQEVEINYGEEYSITDDSFSKVDNISYNSDNPDIISVSSDGVAKACAPGDALITVNNDSSVIGEFYFHVNVVPVTGIVLSTDQKELSEGESFTLSYTLFPETASDYGLAWKSADPSVATVVGGKIVAIGEGQTTISVSNTDGIMATWSVTVKKAKPNLKTVCDKCEVKSSYASVAADGSYLSIDTNPKDIDDYIDAEAYFSISNVNAALGIPDSLMATMNRTRAIDGTQSETFDNIKVSWSYHPDNGLEVVYQVI